MDSKRQAYIHIPFFVGKAKREDVDGKRVVKSFSGEFGHNVNLSVIPMS